jgi:transposase
MSPRRDQLEWQAVDLESLLPAEHRARVIWAAVEQLDLNSFYAEIAARGSAPGRSAHDPRLLLALWLYATSEGLGSARHLERLCERDIAYRWMCGGVTPNHHALSDFRVQHGDKLDGLMTQVLASLMNAHLLTLTTIAQDGMRVRASAGAASYRRLPRLEMCREQAKARIAQLRKEIEDDPAASSAREKKAQERAATDRLARVEDALKVIPKMAEVQQRNAGRASRRKKSKAKNRAPKAPRASTTDHEARVMKMPDGGFRPAYNVQLATDVDARIIVGVDVTNEGSDAKQLMPMLDQLKRRTNRQPKRVLVDGGFGTLASIDAAEKRRIKVYAPVPVPKKEGVDPHARKRDDTDETARWRARMKHDKAKALYKQRAATAETVNADLRCWRGLDRFRVRGQRKVRAVALMAALTHNILRAEVLRAAA